MFIHRLRRFTPAEEKELHGHVCGFGCEALAKTWVFGTSGGHRVRQMACEECYREFSGQVRSSLATPVTHGEPDESYDGRKDYSILR
jgi:hypothetical protein